MQFPAFPGLELVNREGLLKAFKSSQKRKYLIWQYYNNYYYQFGVVAVLS